ncbi:hypothetical protein [Mobiluncus porci]|uniref:Uncharacterized protein n=1 Tax=Mobiluncus porci TaxID=2652278 RepID=A0A7K0K082_9ACTO|nr:hypothetical protein [Mobiluncus porci]MST48892.1 hypothetical protein [Mobiluncus porci]
MKQLFILGTLIWFVIAGAMENGFSGAISAFIGWVFLALMVTVAWRVLRFLFAPLPTETETKATGGGDKDIDIQIDKN